MNYLMLVDSVTPVPEGYIPALDDAGGVMLERRAAAACRDMLAAAAADGVGIKALSGYRTTGYQRLLWNRSIHGYMAEGLSAAEAECFGTDDFQRTYQRWSAYKR